MELPSKVNYVNEALLDLSDLRPWLYKHAFELANSILVN